MLAASFHGGQLWNGIISKKMSYHLAKTRNILILYLQIFKFYSMYPLCRDEFLESTSSLTFFPFPWKQHIIQLNNFIPIQLSEICLIFFNQCFAKYRICTNTDDASLQTRRKDSVIGSNTFLARLSVGRLVCHNFIMSQ